MAKATKFYTWSTIYNGGETKTIKDRKIIVKRNVIEPGEEVSQTKLKLNDVEWKALVDGGSVRPYKYPDMPDSYGGSPMEFVMSQLRAGGEEISQDALLGLALSIHEGDDDGDGDEESELAAANAGS